MHPPEYHWIHATPKHTALDSRAPAVDDVDMLRDEGQYRKLCRRWNRPNEAHFLTFSCYGGKPFLSRERCCRWTIDAINAASVELNFAVWAWVLMPEHVHLLIYPSDRDYSIGRVLKAIKQPVAQRAVAWVRTNAPEFLEQMRDVGPDARVAHRFWQRGGGYDRNVFSTDEVWEKIQYIHDNPVRRKLVISATQWRWSSACDHAGTARGLIEINPEFLPRT